ncbi:SDR family NAD(P)-dependent oxidoreductase [Parvibaculum sp. MBR-TMA-1.3b-4.2]|jgi:NAD(P)-dependent dehydrogenase (short-subunit alcohol dehydrogenase family)
MTATDILQDKVAIVTGGARGIGKAIARTFADQGAKVMIADIDEEEGEAAAAEIVGRGGEAAFAYCDVGERLDVRNMVCATTDTWGRVDILVNNAGIALGGDFLTLDEESFDKVIRTNLKGAFLVGQAVAQQMVAQVEEGGEPGSIINMSSVNAIVAIPSQAAYAASKGGIKQLTETMAISLAPHGIRVNAIGPGSIQTDMLTGVNDDKRAKDVILSRTPLGRIGQPDEVASVAVFLASSGASYVTGQTIYADGGRLALNYTMEGTSKADALTGKKNPGPE